MTVRKLRTPRAAATIAAALSVAVSAGCGELDPAPASKAEAGRIPPSAQPAGDPGAGYDALINGGYVTCGIPLAAWQRMNPDPAAPPSLPGRNRRNRDLPYFLSIYTNEHGVDLVTTNCLFCHGAVFDGKLIVGLGNESLDFTGDPAEMVDAAGSYVSDRDDVTAWEKWAERMSAIAPYMMTDTVGVNPATNLTLALMAHRDPKTLAWSNEPLMEPPPERPLPVSVPPWWRMAKKHALFYNGMARGDHARYMMMKSLVCADDVADVEAIEGMFADVRAYISTLEAPEFPRPVDANLAAEGEATFERHCAECHGTYGAEASYPNLLVDLDAVGTDRQYALQAYRDGDRFVAWFNSSWYGRGASASPASGYVAPPLDGVWITAPYLHNGSVPTIEALLDSSKRPSHWIRDFDDPEFDWERLGWSYQELEQGKSDIADSETAERVYDTTLPGYSNQGHPFGDPLSEAERGALIEYLKTI